MRILVRLRCLEGAGRRLSRRAIAQTVEGVVLEVFEP